MPKGPRGERRKADTNQRAFQIVQIATGEQIDPVPSPRGRPGGLAGGRARASKLSVETRKEIAKKAAKGRWGKKGTD